MVILILFPTLSVLATPWVIFANVVLQLVLSNPTVYEFEPNEIVALFVSYLFVSYNYRDFYIK